jgi:hypothetical protein
LDRCRNAPAAKGFRRLKAYEQLSALRTALAAHQTKPATNSTLNWLAKPPSLPTGNACPTKFNKDRDNPAYARQHP